MEALWKRLAQFGVHDHQDGFLRERHTTRVLILLLQQLSGAEVQIQRTFTRAFALRLLHPVTVQAKSVNLKHNISSLKHNISSLKYIFSIKYNIFSIKNFSSMNYNVTSSIKYNILVKVRNH